MHCLSLHTTALRSTLFGVALVASVAPSSDLTWRESADATDQLTTEIVGIAATSGSFGPAVRDGRSRTSAVIWYTDRARFRASVPALCNTEDFEASTTASVAIHAEPLWVCTNDPWIMPGDIDGSLTMRTNLDQGISTLAAGFAGQPSVAAGAYVFYAYTTLGFSNKPTGIGFDVYSNGGPPDPVEIRVYDYNNNQLGVQTVNASASTGTFVGVQVIPDTNPIWRIEVESIAFAGELVDDVEWNGHCQPTLTADSMHVQSGQSLQLAISETPPNSHGLLYVTKVNGMPYLQKALGPIAVHPLWCSRTILVPPAPTMDVSMRGIIVDPVSGVTLTNEVTIFIN